MLRCTYPVTNIDNCVEILIYYWTIYFEDFRIQIVHKLIYCNNCIELKFFFVTRKSSMTYLHSHNGLTSHRLNMHGFICMNFIIVSQFCCMIQEWHTSAVTTESKKEPCQFSRICEFICDSIAFLCRPCWVLLPLLLKPNKNLITRRLVNLSFFGCF